MTKKKWRREDITPEILRELLHLDEETGKLYWKKRGPEWFGDLRTTNTWNSCWAGKLCGVKKQQSGVRVLNVLRVLFTENKLIFAVKNGYFPKGRSTKVSDMEYVDGNHSLSAHMRDMHVNYNSYRGVYNSGEFSKLPFRAKISNTIIGYFETQVEAAKAHDKEAFEKWGHHARLNFPEDYGLQPHDDDAMEVPEGYFED